MLAAIGDIHGCYDKLMRLMDKLSAFPIRKFVFLGDYIDRGPQARETLNFLWRFREQENCVFLVGNHDLRARSVIFGENLFKDVYGWVKFGGEEAVKSMTGLAQVDILKPQTYAHLIGRENLDFLRNLRQLYHVEDDHVFVHAGLRDFSLPVDRQDDVPPELQARHCNDLRKIHYSYLNVRAEFFLHQSPFPNGVVVHGHTRVMDLPKWMMEVTDPNQPYFRYSERGELISIAVDTGAYTGRPLSAVLIEGDRYQSVGSED